MSYDDTHYKRDHTIYYSANQENSYLDLLLSFVWTYSEEDEEWKEVKGYEGKYFVSNYGRVLSLCCNGYKLLKPYTCQNGYDYIYLSDKTKRKSFRLHRLVAKSFVLNPNQKPIVHHKDTNKRRNVASNLLFLTDEEHHKIHNKLRKK